MQDQLNKQDQSNKQDQLSTQTEIQWFSCTFQAMIFVYNVDKLSKLCGKSAKINKQAGWGKMSETNKRSGK